jgi:predicted phosphate transport protein (TIGR00153 family)
MKEMRNILGWLGMQEEHAALLVAQQHVEETCKTVDCFAAAVKGLIDDDMQARTQAIHRVRQSEHEADMLKIKMISTLSSELLMPLDRDDMLQFVKALDRIADKTNGAAKLIGFIEQRLPDNVLKNISAATDLMVTAISQLKQAINAAIRNDVKVAIESCQEIARVEHDADDQKRLLIESVLHAELTPPTLLLSYNLAEYLESITDRILEAADIVRVVAAKGI